MVDIKKTLLFDVDAGNFFIALPKLLTAGEHNSLPVIGRIGDFNPFVSQVPLAEVPASAKTGEGALSKTGRRTLVSTTVTNVN